MPRLASTLATLSRIDRLYAPVAEFRAAALRGRTARRLAGFRG